MSTNTITMGTLVYLHLIVQCFGQPTTNPSKSPFGKMDITTLEEALYILHGEYDQVKYQLDAEKIKREALENQLKDEISQRKALQMAVFQKLFSHEEIQRISLMSQNASTCEPVTKWLDSQVGKGGLRLVRECGMALHMGRLEVEHNGIWGTVCDDDFEDPDGRVACWQLGFRGFHKIANAKGGKGDIWMDDVKCGGAETRIQDCEFAGWGIENCGHHEDVALWCIP